MLKTVLISALLFPGLALVAASPAKVSVDPELSTAPRPLEPQTEQAAVRDYIQSWQAMQSGFDQNRPDLLNADFVGGAMNKLAGTIKQQAVLGLRTHYQDLSHKIQFLFYSPEGLSIEFTDEVEFDLQVFDHGHLVATHHETARYLVMMSPSEVRWRVRVFQALQG
ncbi:MAG TPA: hypothetical protein VGR47_08945 [Terracidiphilus sp.]|nr:hypothetical protein [Terracidiphilus sp.]